MFDTVDPHLGNDEADAAYLERNRLTGRMPGEVTIRIRYAELVTPWFEFLCLSSAELEGLLEGTGWALAWSREAEPPDWYGVLAKA
ncbi:MAG TPA: hypothetical protein VH281_09580 [Gaiellaceae bacterium]